MNVLPDYSEGYKVYPEVQELLVMLAQCWDALKPYLLPPVSEADYDCQALLLVELYILIGKQQAHCGFHADSDTHSTHIRTVIPR